MFFILSVCVGLVKIVKPQINQHHKPSNTHMTYRLVIRNRSSGETFPPKITPETPYQKRKRLHRKGKSHCLLINSQLTDFFFFSFFLLEKKKESSNGTLIRTSPLVDGKRGAGCMGNQVYPLGKCEIHQWVISRDLGVGLLWVSDFLRGVVIRT